LLHRGRRNDLGRATREKAGCDRRRRESGACRQPLSLRLASTCASGLRARRRQDARMSSVVSRREFLKTGGALVVSFTLAPPAWAPQPPPGATYDTRTLDPAEVDGFIAIDADGGVTIFSGLVDLGQGLRIAIPQMAAEELGVDLARVTLIEGDTALCPNQGS